MTSENVSKEMVKSFIDLANRTKGLMDENQRPSVQQELEKLFPSTRGGEGEVESRERHRVGVGESSAYTVTDTNTSFATSATTKRAIAEIWGSQTCGDF